MDNTEKLSPIYLLFLFYIVTWWLQIGERIYNKFGIEIRIEAIVAVILLTYAILDPFRKKENEKAGFLPYVVSLFLVMLLKVIFAFNSKWAWFIFYEKVLKYSVMGFLISRYVRTTYRLKLLIFVWLACIWKGTLEGVIGGITGSLVWENQGIMRLHGNGLWSHPNSFSQFALGALPFCIYLFPLVKRWFVKVAIISLVLFASYVVLYTGSRTGYLGYFLLLVLVLWKLPSEYKKKFIVLVLILLPIVYINIPQQYKERFESIYSGQEKEGHSKQHRIRLMKNGWTVFIHHPFGVGVCNYRFFHLKKFGRIMDQHCLFTEVLSEVGIQGFIVFTILLLKINSVLKKSKDRIQRILNVGFFWEKNDKYDIQFLLASTQAVQIYFWLKLFLDIFGMDLYGITWWFVIGFSSSLFYITANFTLLGEQIEGTNN